MLSLESFLADPETQLKGDQHHRSCATAVRWKMAESEQVNRSRGTGERPSRSQSPTNRNQPKRRLLTAPQQNGLATELAADAACSVARPVVALSSL